MFSLENDSDVVVCPYNKAHRLLRRRLQSHLIKCRKNYPQLELQKCPFNVTHHIPEPEFAIHVTNCPDRKLITQYKYDTVEVKDEVRVKHAPVECDENWDDTEVEDYDPQKFIDKKNVLRKPFGVPPAERKKFIKSERKRLGDDGEYSDSEEDDEAELENLAKQALKQEKNNSENEDETASTTVKAKRAISASPSPPPTEAAKKPSAKSRSRSPKNKKSKRKSKSRSRSPVTSAFYRRIHGRDSRSPQPPPAPRYKEPSYIRERSPVDNAAYNIDDDPYYSGGSSSSSQRNDNYRVMGRENHLSQYPEDLYSPSAAYIVPPLVAYPTRLPTYGRGAHRGYGYDRRSEYRNGHFP
ncbi:protein D7-like [Eurosta solidaginis]|uniref:protein D7-like n=1 Tax=Eurosta solidaginis TaxID=178769 RepID=UPI00353071DD